MKTQISVLVKAESMMGKSNAHRMLGPLALLTKSSVILVLDGEEHELKESKTPYVFDVTPGRHVLQFVDPMKDKKDRARALDNLFTSATVGIVGLLGGAGWLGFEAGDFSDLFTGVTEDGAVEVNLGAGDIIKLACKGTGKGIPKVTVLKK